MPILIISQSLWAILLGAGGCLLIVLALLLGLRDLRRGVANLTWRLADLEYDWTLFKAMSSVPDFGDDGLDVKSAPDPSPAHLNPPPVCFSRETLERLTQSMRRDLDRRPDIETGFALVGRVEGDGPDRRIIVNGMIGAGNGQDRSAGHVRFDRDYQQSRLERMQMVDRRSSHIGDAHTHPGAMDRCSHGDFVTDMANVRASATQEMIFMIVTELRYHKQNPVQDPKSLYAMGLKLDVFYLGVASDYQYERILPRVADEEAAIMIPPVLDRLANAFPDRVRLDWACLRSMEDWHLRTRQIRIGDGDQDCLELSCQNQPCRIVLVVAEDIQRPPTVFIEEGDSIEQFEPEFLAGGWTPHVWLTEIVLAVIRARAQKPDPSDNQAAALVRRMAVTV